MGTAFSTFSTYAGDGEWDDIQNCFQDGLYNAYKAKQLEEAKTNSKINELSEAFVNTKFNPVEEEAELPEPPTVLAESDVLKNETPQPSNPVFQPSRSRLPTPINRSVRSSKTAQETVFANANNNNNNVTPPEVLETPIVADPSRKSDKKDSKKEQYKLDVSNCNTEKAEPPYYPEPWPTSEMAQEHLSKRSSQPSTILFAKFAPRNTRTYIEIKYSTNKDTGETIFECSDKLDSLIQSKEGNQVGESQKEQIEYFFLIFKTCVNLLQGQVWWNGYSLVFDQNSTKNRLKISAFEMEPSQLLFELTNMKDLEVHRSSHKIELRSKTEGGSVNDFKYFKIRGPNVKDMKVGKLRGSLITVHLPEFNPAKAQLS